MLCFKGVEDTFNWINTAKPDPTEKDITTQIGVHLEEFAEFLDILNPVGDMETTANLVEQALVAVNDLAEYVKKNGGVTIHPVDRVAALDALCDGIVTAVAIAQHHKMDIISGLNEVNRSNFSKFDTNGTPILDSNRKIMKGPGYSKPDLTNMV